MKKISISLILVFSALLILSAGCDVIDGPKRCIECIAENAGQKVLLEDWTGHKCGNCPRGHEKAKELEELYGDNLVAIAIHAEFFAKPSPPKYPADYRTDVAEAWDDYFAPNYPSGMINRKEIDGDITHAVADWGTHIGAAIAETPEVAIGLETSVNESIWEVNVDVTLDYLQTHTTDDHLVVVITEDSVISPQTDYSMSPEDILDYVHMHMYRASVTPGNWGESLKDGATITEGERLERSFTFTVDSTWNPYHLNVVTYVMNGETKEIYQVEEAHLY